MVCMNTPEENNDPAWQLLIRARRTQAGPYFSRRVLREVRQATQEPRPWFSTWFLSWRGATAAMVAAVVCLGAFGMLRQSGGDVGTPGPSPLAAAVHASPADADFDPASEVGNFEYLGQLMAVSDPATLDDAALADLLF